MGRGRAKAKQTKVARKLKYSTTGTDLERLRAELAAERPSDSADTVEEAEADNGEYDEYDDPYADLYADDEDEESADR